MNVESSSQQTEVNNRSITQVIYGLYAASLVVGVTMFVAIVLNYIKRDDVVNTLYESHFRWQIRTFWFSILWCVVGLLTFAFIIGFVIWGAAYIWFIYRVAKGWVRLNDGKPMYVV